MKLLVIQTAIILCLLCCGINCSTLCVVSDASSVASSGKHCINTTKNITLAFVTFNNYSRRYSTILVEGQHKLLPSLSNTFYNVTNLDIIGQNSAEITCNTGAGLAFIGSAHIVIKNIRFIGCGAVHNGTSKANNLLLFWPLSASLYFLKCVNITMDSIIISDSDGFGVQIYATVGFNTVKNSIFTNNGNSQQYGGGVHIEFPYCYPTSKHLCVSNYSDYYKMNSTYIIINCIFEDNNALIPNASITTYNKPYNKSHVSFGRGGGLSFVLKGEAKNNKIVLNNCTFSNNSALFGGGLYIQLLDEAQHNVVIVNNSLFNMNRALHVGGGAKVNILSFSNSSFQFNDVHFSHCHFNNNSAMEIAGGLSLLATKEQRFVFPTNVFLIDSTQFFANKAQYGAALDLSTWPSLTGITVQPELSSCNFTDNLITTKLGRVVGSGTVYLSDITVNLYDSIIFKHNNGSAVVASGSVVSFKDNCSANFTENTGISGGALSLFAHSYIVVGKRTTFSFINNVASTLGGAIFAFFAGERTFLSSRDCFLRYYDVNIGPYKWLTHFYFRNNTANKQHNSIYATSLLACAWGMDRGVPNTLDIQKNVFCWNSTYRWIYKTDNLTLDKCHNQIATAPANFSSEVVNISVVPGMSTHFSLTAFDAQNDTIKDNLYFLSSQSDDVIIEGNYDYISTTTIKLKKASKDVTNGTVILQTLSPHIIQSILNVTFKDCSLGLQFQNETCKCPNNSKAFHGFAKCYRDSKVELQRGYWIGNYKKDNVSDIIVVAQCYYCNNNASTTELDGGFLPVKHLACKDNREGFLCSECRDGTAPAINTDDSQCVECNGVNAGGILYLITHFIFTTIIFFVILFTNFALTSGKLAAVTLFAQMFVVILGDIDLYTADIVQSHKLANGLHQFYRFIYGLFNLDFFLVFPPRCLGPNLNSAQVLALLYIPATYPLFLVLATYIVFKLENRWACLQLISENTIQRIRPIRDAIDKRKHQENMDKKVSLAQKIWNAIATATLLSYTKITIMTYYLLTPVLLWDKDNKIQGIRMYFYAKNGAFTPEFTIPALIIGLYVLSFPFFLLLFFYEEDLSNRMLHNLEDSQPSQCEDEIRIERTKPRFLNHLLYAYQRDYKRVKSPNSLAKPNEDDNKCFKCFKNHWQIRMGRFWKWESLRNDFRWVPGAYFFVRIFLLSARLGAFSFAIQYIIQIIICSVTAILVVFFQPYRKSWMNKLDASVFQIMVMILSISLYQYYLVVAGSGLSMWGFVFQYFLISLPLLYLVSLVVNSIWKSHWCNKMGKSLKLKWCPKNGKIKQINLNDFAENEEEEKCLNAQFYDVGHTFVK